MKMVENERKRASDRWGTNYTFPSSGKNWRNFFLDKKNAKAVYTKYVVFGAKRDLKDGAISDKRYQEIRKELFGKAKS